MICLDDCICHLDICSANELGHRNTALLHAYAEIDPRAKSIGCIMKMFVKAYSDCDALRLTLLICVCVDLETKKTSCFASVARPPNWTEATRHIVSSSIILNIQFLKSVGVMRKNIERSVLDIGKHVDVDVA